MMHRVHASRRSPASSQAFTICGISVPYTS
jgi:hypothetical protein